MKYTIDFKDVFYFFERKYSVNFNFNAECIHYVFVEPQSGVSYVPIYVAIISAIVSCSLAVWARKLTKEQKIISEEAKNIAKEKLNLDKMDKRIALYKSLIDSSISLIFNNIKSIDDVDKIMTKIIVIDYEGVFVFDDITMELIKKTRSYCLRLSASIKKDLRNDEDVQKNSSQDINDIKRNLINIIKKDIKKDIARYRVELK